MIRRKRARSHPKTDTPDFKNWFGGSKIVDQFGDPMIVYHGTNATFGVFDPARGTEYGIYMTPSKRYAAAWGNVMPLHVRMVTPLEVESKGDISPRDLTKADVDRLMQHGYDGIVSVTPGRPVWTASELVAFDPRQVRTAAIRFDEHDIEFPEWLRCLGFVDESWHKDVAAQATRVLSDDTMLCVWVNYDDPEDREGVDYKFAVHLLHKQAGSWKDIEERAEFQDDLSAAEAVKARLAAHWDRDVGGSAIRPEVARRMRDLARQVVDLEFVSEVREAAEKELYDLVHQHLTPEEISQCISAAAQGSVRERIDALMEQLRLPPIEETADGAPSLDP
jgi:hypothetical protein